MNIVRFFTIAIVTLTLLSCSEESGPGSKEVGHSKLSITIKGEADTAKSKAMGSPTQAEESTVNNFIVYIFKADGSIDVKPTEYATMPSGGMVSDLHVTTDAKEIYVIANTKSATATELQESLLAVTKKSDLQAVVGRGFETSSKTGIPTQSSTNLWMSGKNVAPFTPVAGGNVTATVTLKYVGAKIRITSVTVDPSMTGLILQNVEVFNGAAATRLIPAADDQPSLIPTFTPEVAKPFYVGARMMTSFAYKPSIAGVNNEYSYAITGMGADRTITEGKNQQYFYVFENDGAATTFEAQPTIITLKAMDPEYNDIYYSVLFKAGTDLGYEGRIIERGKSYDITMAIKKKGLLDPTIPALKTTVEVTITPATWNTVTIDKVYE